MPYPHHHAEPVDPALWDTLSAKINDVLGIPSGMAVFFLGALIVLFPVAVAVAAFLRRRAIEVGK